MPSEAPQGERVQINFSVAVPDGGPETKAMGNTPTIDPNGFYVAVFGGSGYFNEWVKATVVSATANYDGTNNTKYTLSASLSVSDSRLRVHFIANCPAAIRNNPPISGSQDTEDYVMSKIRSQLSDTYNDGYWQKIILPNGVKAEKALVNGEETWVPTNATMLQFPDPIVMVRNFARVYLRNLTPIYDGVQLVTIKKFGLAYAPAEGPIAPMLAAPYTANASGQPISVNIDVDEEDPSYDSQTPIYYENFFINYQNYPITSTDPAATLLTGPPFNYGGYSPSDQSYDYYPNNSDKGAPLDADLQDWDNEHPENNVLYVYERTIPSAARRATRVIIKAQRVYYGNDEGDKYYALDIVNTEGRSIALLRNQTYTVHLLNIEADTGESDINKASTATSATVSGDPNYQTFVNISDGKSSIGTSFTEKFYVQPQEDYVMFRYIPTNIDEELNGVTYTANKEYLDLVTIDVGSVDTESGTFTAVTPADAAAQYNLSFAVENNEYKVWIDVDANDKVIPYVRSNNNWVAATAAQIADENIEKWGMVKYQLNESYKDDNDFFTEERSQAIHIQGSFNGREMSRNVIIKTSPRQVMHVSCQQKYVMQKAGESEVVRILIPTGLSRSVFPLEFEIEADGYSLTPDGDALPVTYGTSIIPGNNKPSFYFVKTLTEDAYKALPTTLVNGATWKVVDCHFKTTLSQNACTVYVYNRYFTETNSNDDFHNFVQRLFTTSGGSETLALPSTVYRHGNVSLEVVLDYAHRNSTDCAWWDPTNSLGVSQSVAEAAEKGLSDSYRVLPPIFTVELLGFTPQYGADGETPVTPGLSHVSGNKYSYNVGTGRPTSDMATVTLALTASGSVGSTATVKLTTENLTENPDLYKMNTVSSTIQGATFSNLTFGTSPLPLGLNKTTNFSFRYVDGLIQPVTITFSNLTVNGTDSRLHDNGDGTWTFTPNDSNITQTISLKSTSRFTAGSVTLNADDYNEASASISRPTTFSIAAGKLRAGTRRPYSSSYQVYGYYTNNYSNTYYINSSYNGQYTGFNTSSPYASTYNLNVDLTKYGDAVEDGKVYFRYQGYEAGQTNYGYHYASAKLADIIDAIDAGGNYTLNFKMWTSKTATIDASAFSASEYATNNSISIWLYDRLSYTTVDGTPYLMGANDGYYNMAYVYSNLEDYNITRIVTTSRRSRNGNSWVYYTPTANYSYVATTDATDTPVGSDSNSNSGDSPTWTWTGSVNGPAWMFLYNENIVYIRSITITYETLE